MSYSSHSGLAGFQSWSAAKIDGNNGNNRVVKSNSDRFHTFQGLPSATSMAFAPLETLHARLLHAKQQSTMLKQRVISEVIKSNTANGSVNTGISDNNSSESDLLMRINKLEEQLKKVTSLTTDPIANNENVINTDNKVATARRDANNTARKSEKNAIAKPINSAKLKNAVSMTKAENLFKPFSKKNAEEIEDNDDLDVETDDITSEVAINKAFDKKVSNNLTTLAEDVTKFMKQNTFKDSQLTNEEQLLVEERKNNKSNFTYIVKRNTTLYKMPKWRHVLLGNTNPEPALVLKGKRLFHVIAWGIVILFIRPSLSAKKRRLGSRRKDKSDLLKAILLYTDAWDNMLAKICKQSLASIFTDKQLDFNLNVSNMKKLNERVLQIKVRVKGIITGIVSSPAIPNNMLDFLVMFTESGNYYPKYFLYSYESSNLSFDTYGATTEMLLHVQSMTNKSTILVDKHTYLDASKVKSVVLAFILVKVLINRILLSPWLVGVCGIPNDRKTIYNFRVVASIMYEIIRLIDPAMPPVASKGSAGIATNVGTVTENNDAENAEVSKFIDVRKSSSAKSGFEEDNKDESLKNFFSSLVGIKSTAFADDEERQLTNALISIRPKFSTLQELHSYLLPPSNFIHAKPLLDPWMGEFAGLLDKWVTSVIQSVIELRQRKIEELYGVDEDHLAEQVLTGRVHGSVNNLQYKAVDDTSNKYTIPKLNLPA